MFNLLERQGRQSARQMREAEDREHRRVLRLEDEVNARIESASMHAIKELNSIDKAVRLTRNFVSNRNSVVEQKSQVTKAKLVNDEAQRSAFFLRLNHLQSKKPKRLIIRKQSFNETKFFSQEMNRVVT